MAGHDTDERAGLVHDTDPPHILLCQQRAAALTVSLSRITTAGAVISSPAVSPVALCHRARRFLLANNGRGAVPP
jgi:hypothetical protein